MFRVVAPLVLVRDESGRTHHAYEGAVVEINADHAAYLLSEGMVVACDDTTTNTATAVVDVGEDVDAAAGTGDPGAGPVSRPQHVAPKAQWVEFAVAQGFDRDEAQSMSKAALISSLK